MKQKWFINAIAVILLIVIAFLGLANKDSVVAAQDEGSKIEGLLLDRFTTDGSADYIVRFTEQADLSPAYSMDWEARGEFVYNTLRDIAARSQENAKAILDSQGFKYETFIAGNELYVWSGNQTNAYALAALPEVSSIRATQTYFLDPAVDTTPFESIHWAGDFLANNALTTVGNAPEATLAWGISYTKANQFWSAFGRQGDGIKVATIDSGVQWNHPALDQAFACPGAPTNPACWRDPSNVCGAAGACDNVGHGTHVLGTMVGDDDPSLAYEAGMAPNAKWIACKGCETSSCSDFALNACADWILAPGGSSGNRPNVVNNSWGSVPDGNTWYLLKVNAWRAAGIFPAFSAGNSGPGCDTLGDPGSYQESFASAANDAGGAIGNFSSRGPSAFGHDPYTKPNITAPGVNVCSSIPGSSWSCGYSGTSMASPHTAGAVALLWSCNPALVGQIDQTFQILQNTATTAPAGTCGAPPDGQGNYTFGYGYLNVLNAGNSICADPDIDVSPTSLSAGLFPNQVQIAKLTIKNLGGSQLNWLMKEVSLTVNTEISIPASDGNFPRRDEPASAGPAPYINQGEPAELPNLPLSGEPAYGVQVYPGKSLVYFANTSFPGIWSEVAPEPENMFFAGDFINGDTGTLYVIDNTAQTLFAVDTATGVKTPLGLAVPYNNETWSGMSGANDGTMYASSTGLSRSTLYTINLTNGSLTTIGQITNGPGIIDIAIAPNGNMYGVDIITDRLIQIDRTTGAGTVIGSIGFDANYAQGMDFEENTGILYLAAFNNTTFRGELRVADVNTGNTTLVGPFVSNAEVDAFAFTTGGGINIPWLSEDPMSASNAPGNLTDVTVRIDSTGLAAGVYQAGLRISSNDPDESVIVVPVTLTVGYPDIDVTPSALNETLPPNKTKTVNLTIKNLGGGQLDWVVKEGLPTMNTEISIPASDGNFPHGNDPVSLGIAPYVNPGEPAPPLNGILSNEPAYGIELNLDRKLVYFPNTSYPGTWNELATETGNTFFAGDFFHGDTSKLYVLDYATNTLNTVNTTSGVKTTIGPAIPYGSEIWTGLTEAANGTAFASSSNVTRSTLYTIDLTTGAASIVAQITNGPAVIDIDFGPSGNLYGVDILNDQLIRIDPATAVGTVIGSIGFDANFAQGMDYEKNSGVLYLAAFNSTAFRGELRIIDVNTGNTLLVGPFPYGAEVDAFSFTTGNATEIPWLSENPVFNSLAPGNTFEVSVTFDTTGRAIGQYHANLLITSNDPDEAVVIVPVNLKVIYMSNLPIVRK